MNEISKPEYVTAKAAAVKQRDTIAARIVELEATLENTGENGGLQNHFTSTFEKYIEVEKITSEITAEVLKEVRIYPDGRLEIVWNFCDELERLVLDLQCDHQDGKQKSLDLLPNRIPRRPCAGDSASELKGIC